jgi:hypothetical protein
MVHAVAKVHPVGRARRNPPEAEVLLPNLPPAAAAANQAAAEAALLHQEEATETEETQADNQVSVRTLVR